MQPGAVIASRFELERQVAAGGLGRVFRAYDKHAGVVVALKLLHHAERDAVARFQREAATLAELAHPGIVRYVAHGELPSGEPFLAMEWLDGEDLSSWIKRRRQQTDTLDGRAAGPRAASYASLAETMALARRVTGGLAAVHARGLVHRDIKPANIFLPGSAPDRAKLVDFGLARLSEHGSSVTRSGGIVGTPAYMAPEQARGERELDPRVDVWALGCVIYACLIGASPFAGGPLIAMLAKVLAEPAPRLRDLVPGAPRHLEDLLLRMLAKDPALRPASAAEVAEELSVIELDASAEMSTAPPLRAPGPSAPAALTTSEQRIECLIIGSRDDATFELMSDSASADTESAVRQGLSPYGVQVEMIRGDSFLITMTGARAAADQAARAARAALAMQTILPRVALAIASGRMVAGAPSSVGDRVERAAGDLALTPSGKIRLDPLTASLLEGRFEITYDEDAPYLVGEAEVGGHPRPLLGKPPAWVGRERELAMLEGTFAECVAEPVARAVLITAPPGFGKSRLRFELLRRLRARDEPPLVLFGQGDSIGAGSPFMMLAPAIRRLAGILDGEPAPLQCQRLAARLGRHLPAGEQDEAIPLLGEMVKVPFPDESSEPLCAARKDPSLMASAVSASFLRWLEAECGASPVLIVLEDLHWGDLPSVKLVDAALRSLRDLPLMVVAFARPEVGLSFPQMWSDHAVQSIRLGALSRRASEKLVRQSLAAVASDEEIQRVVDRAEGVPLYAEELIRAVAARTTHALPDTVLGALQARLDALGGEAKRVLRAGSVFGEVFWRGGALALLGDRATEFTVDEWLDELVSLEVITRVPVATIPGEVEYAFRHALIRDAAYAMLTEDDRALGHRLAAGYFERSGRPDALVLAKHYIRGGAREEALRWFHRAAEHALECGDLAAATHLVEETVRCGATGEARGALRQLQSAACYWQGKYAEARACAVEAVGLLARGSRLWFRALGDAIAASSRLGDQQAASHWGKQAFLASAAEDALDAQIITFCRMAMAVRLFGAGRELLAAVCARVEMLAAVHPDLGPRVLAQVHQVAALSATQRGDLEAGLGHIEKAVALFERAGDRFNAALEQGAVCVILGEIGDFARALKMSRRVLLASERLGAAQNVTFARMTLGHALLYAGKLDEADTELRDVVGRCREQRNPRLEGWSRVYLSLLELSRGDVTTAEREARAAIELLLPISPPLHAWAEATLSRVLLAQHRTAEALSAAESAFATTESVGGLTHGALVVQLAYAQALVAAGEGDRACAFIASACGGALGQLDRIENPELKECFLKHPDRASLLALADAGWRR